MFLASEDRKTSEDDSGNSRKKLKLELDEELKAEDFPIIYNIPPAGAPVERRKIRKAGEYMIGPEIAGHRPVRSIVQYLGRKENTNEFYQLKILQLPTREFETTDESQGKILLHTEHSLLSLLEGEDGVIKHHGLFIDLAYEEELSSSGTPEYTGELKKRVVLILDCVNQHPYCDKSLAYTTLQEYLMSATKLLECEALCIFFEIVKVVEKLHKKNVIHRDLKLGNIVLNKNSKKIIITNFGLGKYLMNENMLLNDQRGSPAYISPDVVSGKPYKGKPSDMWALGVIFYIMMYGNFPFFKSTSSALYEQILSGEYNLPSACQVTSSTFEIIKGLLRVKPEHRLTAPQLSEKLEALLIHKIPTTIDQRVPSNLERQQRRLHVTFAFEGSHDQIVPNISEREFQERRPTLENDGVVPDQRFCIRKIPTQSRSSTGIEQIATSQSSGIIQQSLNRNFLRQSRSCTHFSPRIMAHNQRLVQNSNASPRNNSITQGDDTLVKNFFSKLDNHFISGQITPPNNSPLLEFNGILSPDIANSIQRWLLENFGEDPFVLQFFSDSEESSVTKVKNLLMKCGVQMEISIFGPKIARKQYVYVVLIMTYLLKISGYNNTYFITQLSVNR